MGHGYYNMQEAYELLGAVFVKSWVVIGVPPPPFLLHTTEYFLS